MTSDEAMDTSGGDDSGSSDEDDLAALLAHDMKNHLQVADRRLEGYVEENGSDRRLDFVQKSIDRMKEMTEKVLVLSKQGEGDMRPVPVELGEKAEEAWGNLESPDGLLQVAENPEVEADPEHLQRVLENLFDNSLKHGGSDVTVIVGELDSGFYVEDDGPGIPARVRENVFNRGFSAGQGSGLGLYIVDRVAEMHGWNVDAMEGTEGGARFEFEVE